MKGKWLRNWISTCLLIGCIALMTSSVLATDIKLGYVDAERIFTQSKVGNERMAALRNFEEERRKILDAKKSEIEKAESDLNAQRYTLSDEALKLRQEELQRAKIELKRLAEDADRELNKLDKEYLERIDREVSKLIAEFGKREKFTMIFTKVTSSIIYASEEVDLTNNIIALYDQ